MRKFLFLLLFAFTFFNAHSQLSEGGIPVSFGKNIAQQNINELYVQPLDLTQVYTEDQKRQKQGELELIGRPISVNANPTNNGTWIGLEDGSKIWQLKITSPGAEGLIISYSKLEIPYGAKMFLYSPDKKFVIGAFTYKNNKDGNTSTSITPGDEVIIEYYQPKGVYANPVIDINSVGYIYKNSGFNKNTKDFGDSESCEVNVNCSPEGDNWQTQKRGVVRILLLSGGGWGWCSGSLINTTNNNCTPYILTADHCGHDASASELPQWIFYFNYESPNCTNPASEGTLDNQSLTGCSLIANGGNTGDEGSDFFLVETADAVPSTYDPYWNGWDRSNTGSPSGVGIHHPAGDIKKISTYSSTLITSGWNGSSYNSHWKVTWVATANDHGVTEGGSSGSPIFNADGRIVGDLTGGGSYCTAQDQPDYYGKMWFSWDQNAASTSTSGNPQLKPFLDPLGTAPMFIDGRNACTTITSDFSADKTIAYKNEVIVFTENVTIAADPITTWAWDFGGVQATPATNNTAGPVNVSYNTVGPYTCSLNVSDGTLTDDEVKTNYITIVDSLTAEINTATWNVVTGASIDFTDASFGGKGTINSWNWTFNGATPATSTTQNPTGIVWSTSGTYDVELCVGTDFPENDCVTYQIIVSNPTDLQFDFTGTPTTVMVGQGVDFTSTVIANGPINTWNWSFESADTPTSTSATPTGITWSVAGDYTVSLEATGPTNTSTVTKVDYIHVIDSSSVPEADFQANQTTIAPGDIIDYTNLSTNPSIIDSSLWILENADAPNNNITVMLAGNLLGVAYNTLPGHYDATLIIYSSFGTDTMYKDDYIYVIDPNNLSEVHANFKATTTRLIQQGWTVDFTDLSTGPVTDWYWEFEGGTPSTFTGQYPPSITYNSTAGPFDVKLTVSNPSFSDSELKTEYIVVITTWPWPDEEGFCEDDLSNALPNEFAQSARHLINNAGEWGYFPGHNYLKVKYYAEKFTNYTFDKIREIHMAPSRIQNFSQNYNKVICYVWDVDAITGMPDNILGQKITYISDYTQLQYNSVVFDTPVEVFEEFYVGYSVAYPSETSGEPQDTFATYYRYRPNGPNTTVCAKTLHNWKTPTEMLGDTLQMSLDIRLKACIIKVKEIDYSNEVSVYPNPTSGRVTIELGDIPIINPRIIVYDLTGRAIDAYSNHIYGNTYELNINSETTGLYFIKIDFGDAQVTKKISLIK